MADGGHFIFNADGNRQVFHWEQGRGMGRWPLNFPNIDGWTRMIDFERRNVGLDDMWVGAYTDYTDRFWIAHWDGEQWTTYSSPYSNDAQGYARISRVPGSNVLFVAGDYRGNPNTRLYRYTHGVGWDTLQGTANRNGRDVPLAISADECLWACTWNTGSGAVRLRRWISGGGFSVYSGSDLPANTALYDIVEFDGEIFIVDVNGWIYRGTWSGGFVVDNASDGPFTRPGYYASLVPSADGTFLCYQGGTSADEFQIRDGADSWTSVGPTGVSGTVGQPAAIDRQMLMASGDNTTRVSLDGGSTWHSTINGGLVAQGFIEPVSDPDKRILALLYNKWNGRSIWTLGNAPYAPWCKWGDGTVRSEGKADPDDVTTLGTNFSDILAFRSGHVVLAIRSGGTGFTTDMSWHYDPDMDAWTVHELSSTRIKRLYGTQLLAGLLHGVGESGTLYYFRWNGSAWVSSPIPGTTASGSLNIMTSEDGLEIWIGSGGSQLMHSSDGGASWVNRFAAAAAVHATPGTIVRDVWFNSATDVIVALSSTSSPETLFSRWDGSAWSPMADAVEDAGARCLFVDEAGDLWFFGADDGASDSGVYKLTGGTWVLEEKHGGVRSPTGIGQIRGQTTGHQIMAISNDAPDYLDSANDGDGLGWMRARYGTNWPPAVDWVSTSHYQPLAPTPPYLANQNPAPGDSNIPADTNIYLEVLDDNGDLDPLTVKVWINDTLAWSDGLLMIGFLDDAAAVSDGMSYLLRPVNPFEPGVQTVRVTAEDTAGHQMDESYSFTTRPLLVTAADIAEALPNAGIDLLLNSHDIKVENGDLVLVAGVDEVKQHLLVKLKLFLGEWYLDELAGMPYYRDVFVAAPNSRVIETVFRQAILSDEDIEHLREFEMEINRTTRKLDVEFTAVSSVGEVTVSAVFP